MVIKNKVKELKTVDVDTFLSWEFNTLKDSNKRDTTKLENAIIKSGWSFPVIKWHNFVIDGTGRKQAVKNLLAKGYTIKEIPYVEIEADNLEDAKAKALEVSSQFGEITKESFLEFTKDMELDFDTFEIDGMTADAFIEAEEKDDEIPETPEEPKTKLGDLYELCEHRVLCGDSTSLEAVERLMDGKKADISFTSPPYNAGFDLQTKRDSKYIHSDERQGIDYQDLISKTTINSLLCAKDVFVNLQFLAGNKKELLIWLAELADNFKDIFFWKKQTVAPAMAENVSNSQVEVIILFGKENTSRSWGNKKFRGTFSNSIETKSASGENKNHKIHSATYPVELPLSFLKQGYKESSTVLDLFAGTGTTMIACEKLGMKSYMVDIEPLYVDVIVQRYVDYTGNENIKLNGKDIIWKKTEKSL